MQTILCEKLYPQKFNGTESDAPITKLLYNFYTQVMAIDEGAVRLVFEDPERLLWDELLDVVKSSENHVLCASIV